MLARETVEQLQKYNFDLLARQTLTGQRRMRYVALAHLKGDSYKKTATRELLPLANDGRRPRAVLEFANGPSAFAE